MGRIGGDFDTEAEKELRRFGNASIVVKSKRIQFGLNTTKIV